MGVRLPERWIGRLMLMPASLWFGFMLVLPLLVVLIFSFGERGAAGGYVPAFTFDQYANLPARFTAFKNTLILAPLGTLAALLVAYPLAYYLAVKVNPKFKTVLLILVIVPFWTSILIRTYAWIFILGFFAGVLVYAQVFPSVIEPLLSGSSGKMTLNNLLGVPYGIVVLLVVFIALGTFFLLGKIEGRLYNRSQ